MTYDRKKIQAAINEGRVLFEPMIQNAYFEKPACCQGQESRKSIQGMVSPGSR
ncbi:MAG: hypothetical protein V7646_5277 [Pseudonocardia sp.]